MPEASPAARALARHLILYEAGDHPEAAVRATARVANRMDGVAYEIDEDAPEHLSIDGGGEGGGRDLPLDAHVVKAERLAFTRGVGACARVFEVA